jgi:putative peptidoglycan lipid II flippase
MLVLAATVVGLLNNVLIAVVFGLTVRVDAFFAAMMLPSLFMILCVDYLGKNFLPVFAVAKRDGDLSASQMTSTVVTIVALLAAVVTALMVAFSEPLFAVLLPGFDDSEAALVARYFSIMAPSIVLMAVNAFHEYVCQYNEQFTRVVAIRMALPVANLIAIAILSPLIGEYCLPLGYLIGHIVVFVLMARSAQYRFVPRVTIRADLERKIFVNSAILMSTGFISRTRSIVMNVLASTLGGGAISAMALTMKLTEPLERCAFTGARMVMFSRTARMFAEKNERELGQLYATGLRVSFLLLAPLLWWVGLNSLVVVQAFFGRGEFTAEMASLVAGTLMAMIPSVLFSGVNVLLSNAFYAADRVRVPAVIMPLGMLVYVAAAVPLAELLGTQGLALATTISTLVVFICLFVGLSRIVDELEPGRTTLYLLGYGALAGAMIAGTSSGLSALHLPAWLVAPISLPLGAAIYLGLLALSRDPTCRGLQYFARDWYRAVRLPA